MTDKIFLVCWLILTIINAITLNPICVVYALITVLYVRLISLNGGW